MKSTQSWSPDSTDSLKHYISFHCILHPTTRQITNFTKFSTRRSTDRRNIHSQSVSEGGLHKNSQTIQNYKTYTDVQGFFQKKPWWTIMRSIMQSVDYSFVVSKLSVVKHSKPLDKTTIHWESQSYAMLYYMVIVYLFGFHSLQYKSDNVRKISCPPSQSKMTSI